MYYSHKCTYCLRLFTVYETNKYKASEKLYDLIKGHLTSYNEDHKEFQMDDGKIEDSAEILQNMTSSTDKPIGSYEN